MKVFFAFLLCLRYGSSQAGNGRKLHLQSLSGEDWALNHATFSWANCGSEKNPAVLEALSIQPDPITLPGYLQASATGSSNVTLEAPLTVNLSLYKEEAGIWLKIPCVADIGSCVYNDVCALLNMLIPPGQSCPEPLFTYGLPCHCPFKAGKYSLPSTSFNIPYVELPYWMTNGNYKAKAVLTSNEEQLACVKVSFALKAE
ncbi:ganglioside GM2 activator-like [Pristis pectinata]|uniref:ganglioside GM2 activator-like n=1 Tax=Pristis pectinata TaxID=685728 RepID=UPI00223E6321|nr:ganglioside GM2 activator-like [Pristis pectinata]